MAGNRLDRLIEDAEDVPFAFVAVKRIEGAYRILAANTRLLELVGCASESELLELTGGLYRNLIDPGDYGRVELEVERDLAGGSLRKRHMRYRIVTKSGARVDVVDAGSAVEGSSPDATFGLYLSVYDERANSNIYDRESGLHSRAFLLESVDALRADRGGAGRSDGYVVYVQIERFHDFNETYGHDQGTLLLGDVGSLLREVFATDLAARLYADQFVVFYVGDDVRERCEELLRRALGLREAFPVRLGAGIYRTSELEIAPAREIDRAKLAYDSAVRAGKGPIGVYSAGVAAEQQLDVYIVENVDEAIERGYLSAAFQPVVRTMTGEVSSFEALARWNDPVHGAISPGRFIPLLEERRLAHKVDEFMAREACAMLRGRIDRGLPVVPVSVNLSRTDFERFDPVTVVEGALQRYDIEPRLIAIEITESVAMENPRAVSEAIVRFHEAGHEVWMDDFGSAYSSLNVLRNFAFDELKIDMAFMSNLDAKTRDIVTSIVNMAKKLGMRTLAEGVESEGQASFLRSIGCNHIQGYLYGRPVPGVTLDDWLSATHAKLEDQVHAALCDQGGLAPLDPAEAQALIFDDGRHFKPLFVSRKMGLELGLKTRAAALEGLAALANGTVSSFGPMLRHAADAAARSRAPKDFFTTIGARRYGSSVRTTADNGGMRIQLLSFEMLADADSTEAASRRELLLRSIADSFDAVYLVNPSAHSVEVLFSAIPGERVGQVIPDGNLKAYDFVHPDDRLRFLRCFDSTFIAQMLEKSETGSFAVLIRMEALDPERGYTWREFSYLRVGVGDTGSYLLCSRPYPLVDDDREAVSHAMLASAGEDDAIENLSTATGDSAALASPDAPFPYVELTLLRDENGAPADFVYLHASASYARRVGRTPEQLAGARYLAEFPQGSADWPAQCARAIDLGRQVHSVIYGIATRSWMECYIAPLSGRDRVGIVFVSPDNARELTDQELFSSYQDMPLPCLVVRPKTIDGREDSEYVYVNDEYCRLVGKSREELCGHGYRELFSVATTEWVDLIVRAARGERVHERMWGNAQHHWMDARFAPSSVLGCAVVVCVPVDEEHERISELTTKRTTDVAAIDIARRLIVAESHDSAMDSAIYALGRTLRARYLYLIEAAGDGLLIRFAYEDARSAAFFFPSRALAHPERYSHWNEALGAGLTVVSRNVPLSSEGRFERIDLPEDGEWSEVGNLMISPIREEGTLVGMLIALDSDLEQDLDAVSLFMTVAPFFRARFVENRALERAEYDALTGVRSRGALDLALDRVDVGTAGVGIAFADINDLKAANDGGGHAAGDELLKKAAALLCDVFDADNVYRVGGDEFVALLVDVDERRFASFRSALEGALEAAGGDTLSVGYAWTANPDEAKSLVNVADERMYAEKDAYHSERENGAAGGARRRRRLTGS